MPERAATFANEPDRMFEKEGRVHAAPLRIARRKVSAYIAGSDRAEQRIGQGVQPDIRIRMAGKAPVVRDCDAAQHDVIAIFEGVYVETGTRPQVGRAKQPFAVFEIFFCRHFDVLRISQRYRHRQSRRLGDCGVVAVIAPGLLLEIPAVSARARGSCGPRSLRLCSRRPPVSKYR